MSNQQIFGVIGGVVGFFFGYPQLGFVVGSLIGGLLTPGEKTEGPRLDDLKVTVSTYGAGIAQIYGNGRVGGNWVWSTDRLEIATTEGGKGGGPEHTSYAYYIHGFLSLCEAPAPGTTVHIRKMWVDGALKWDLSSGVAFGSALASAENPYTGVTLYSGYEDQLPIADMESWMGGPGSVPAYRGVCGLYIIALETPGGRVPQISVEVCFEADLVDTLYLGEEATVVTGSQISASRMSGDGASSIFFSEYEVPSDDPRSHKRVRVYSLSLGGALLAGEFELGSDYWGAYDALPGDADFDGLCFRQVSAVDGVDSGNNVIFGPEGNLMKTFPLGSVLAFGQSNSSWSKRGEYFLISGDSSQGSDEVCLFGWDSASLAAVTVVPNHVKVVLTDSTAWILVGATSPYTLQARELDPLLSVIDSASLPAETVGMELRLTGDEGDTLALWVSDDATGNLVRVYSVTLDGPAIVFTLRNEAVRVDGAFPHPIEQTIGVAPGVVYGWERVSVGVDTTFRAFMIAFDRVEPAPVKASDIISRQCIRSGLASEYFDVTDIPDADAPWGYKIANPASARSNIQPILTAYGIGSREEDQVLKFFKYGDVTSLVTVPYVELATTEDGQEPGDPFPLTRAQDADLPSSVSVSYINPDFDYQTGTEKYRRQVTDSQNDQTVDLVIATDSDHAMSVAMKICLNAYSERNKRSCKVPRKYSRYSAGDGVTIEYPEGTFGLYRLTSVKDTGLSIEWECVSADSELFELEAVGATGYIGQTVAPLPPPVRMVIGDWPLLRDADNNPGIYTAFGTLGPGGRGATLYVGTDDNSLQERGSVFSFTSIGVAESVLGDWDVNILDQANTITVNAASDAFSSVTIDALIASSTLNACAFGKPGRWEFLQFATASYLGDNQWLIYDFIRGLRGTERNRGNHEMGDLLVLLDPSAMLRPNMDVSELNGSKQYRAVPLGRDPNRFISQSYTNTGEGLRPFSPVNLLHELVGSDLFFTWKRRTRLSTNWLAGVVPLGEASEAYTLTLYTDGTFATVLRTFSVTSATATYTAAQMTADSYSLGDPIYVRVQQISDTVGAGHALEETL